MKKYIIQKTIEAEPMLRYEAEARLGREIDSNQDDGFLVCDMAKLKFDWVSEANFHARPFDSETERMFFLHGKIDEWQKFLSKYAKENHQISQAERTQICLIGRHMRAIRTSLTKILNINALKFESNEEGND